jgi:hypothetical protein
VAKSCDTHALLSNQAAQAAQFFLDATTKQEPQSLPCPVNDGVIQQSDITLRS